MVSPPCSIVLAHLRMHDIRSIQLHSQIRLTMQKLVKIIDLSILL